MANAYFTAFPEGLLDGTISMTVANFKVSLVRGYTFSASHKFVSDVTGAGGTLNGTSAALSSVTTSGGVFDAADTSLTASASASNHGLLIYQASAVTGGGDVAASSQRVVAYYDTGTGLPIQPGTGTVTVTFDNGTNRILKVG